MRAIQKFCLAISISSTLYFLVFGWLIHKPLTLSQSVAMEDGKLAYARLLHGPKLVIFAGSNARFSHNCERLSANLNIPCANMGVAAGMGLDYLLTSLEGVLAPHDIVYMPLEYDQYEFSKSARLHSLETPELFYADKTLLWKLGIDRFAYGAFSFDAKFAVSGFGEMMLARRGYERRFNMKTLNEFGDEQGNTIANAGPYRAYVAGLPFHLPTAEALSAPSDGKALIAGFLDWAHGRGVDVIGGLPTIFDDSPVPDATIDTLRRFYAAHDQSFLVLPNKSQYPRSAFFDTGDHLVDTWQRVHSDALGGALKTFPPFIERR